MAQAAWKVWRDLWHRSPAPGLGGGVCAKVHLAPNPDGPVVQAFLVSTMVVGLAEIGDKTQILSLMLAARFQRPLPIIFGILFATLANHVGAGLAGTYFGDLLNGPWLRWILGISFLSVAVWALFPDNYEGNDKALGRAGAFMSSLAAFFLAEIGDKTQIATIGLAARFEQFYPVVLGTTLGMMLANIPAVFIGDRIADKLPLKPIRVIAAVVFAMIGILTLTGVGA
jgi:putative Ca2+/H+ antiporter (TMEM165/GDT1 family)